MDHIDEQGYPEAIINESSCQTELALQNIFIQQMQQIAAKLGSRRVGLKERIVANDDDIEPESQETSDCEIPTVKIYYNKNYKGDLTYKGYPISSSISLHNNRAGDTIPIHCMQRTHVRCGIGVELPAGWGLQIRPTFDITSEGIIIPDTYRIRNGELEIIIINTNQNPYHLIRGARLGTAEFVKMNYANINLNYEDENEANQREPLGTEE